METVSAWLKPEIIWFIIGLVLLVLEFSAPGLIIFFFGAGAWIVSLVCLLFDISVIVQLFIFLITSVVMLIFLRKYLKKVFKLESFERQNELEDFIGKRAVALTKISPGKPGKVEFNGTAWQAESYSNVAKGASVMIIERRSITLIVEPI